MNRRRFLASVGGTGAAMMAGCTALSRPDEPPVAATVELTNTNGVAPSAPLAFDASIVTSTFTVRDTDDPSHPAAVEVTLSNDGEESKTVATGHRRVFSTTRSDDGVYSLLDHDRESEGNIKLADDCWQLKEELVYPAVVRMTELAPGESSSIVLDVLTSHDADECLPSGTYVFSETYSIQGGDLSMNGSFELAVTRPERST